MEKTQTTLTLGITSGINRFFCAVLINIMRAYNTFVFSDSIKTYDVSLLAQACNTLNLILSTQETLISRSYLHY